MENNKIDFAVLCEELRKGTPEGFQYSFFNTVLRNVPELLEKGWTEVPINRHPVLKEFYEENKKLILLEKMIGNMDKEDFLDLIDPRSNVGINLYKNISIVSEEQKKLREAIEEIERIHN